MEHDDIYGSMACIMMCSCNMISPRFIYDIVFYEKVCGVTIDMKY